jgi:hypothetical protein
MSHAASPFSPNALTAAPDASGAAPDAPPANQIELAADVSLETQAAFVRTLAQWGNVRAAARQVGVSRAHLYRMRRASAAFRKLWDAALVLARPQVEEVLADRALNGVQETVFYHGEEVATRTRFDSRLLLAHLGRLDRIASASGVHATINDFDGEVERLLNPPPLYDWDDEEYGEDEDDYGDDGGDEACAEDDGDDAGDEGAAEGGYAEEDMDAFIARLRGNTP